MTRRIVVMVECEECNGSGRFRYPSGRSDGLWLAVDCSECLGRGETESDDLSAKAQKVLETAASDAWLSWDDDGAWFTCRQCGGGNKHRADCEYMLAKEVLGT